MPTINMFSGRSLTAAIDESVVPVPFLLNRLFSGKDEYHISDTFDLEIIKGDQNIALFSNVDEEAHLIHENGSDVKTYKIPLTSERKVFMAAALNKITALGQIYNGSAADKEKYMNDKIAREVQKLKTRIYRRREQMIAEAISTGAITVAQDNIAFTIDFGFVSDQEITLTGNDLWSASASNPYENIQDWQLYIAEHSGGYAPDTLILGSSAAKYFMKNAQVLKVLAVPNNRANAGFIDYTQPVTAFASFKGKLGSIDVYQYDQKYQATKNGDLLPMIAANKAILIASGSPDFRMHHGALDQMVNGQARVVAGDIIVDSYPIKNKGIEWEVSQKSLPAIHTAGCVVNATVVA